MKMNEVKNIIESHTIVGNIFDCKENIICHQVNMYKKMASGIAKQIRERYPVVYKKYLEHDGRLGEVKLYDVSQSCYNRFKFIANFYSQDTYGYDGKLYTNYNAIRQCFKIINQLGKQQYQYQYIEKFSLAIPYKIGCGLGGGDWDIVSQIIIEELTDIDYTIYKLEG